MASSAPRNGSSPEDIAGRNWVRGWAVSTNEILLSVALFAVLAAVLILLAVKGGDPATKAKGLKRHAVVTGQKKLSGSDGEPGDSP